MKKILLLISFIALFGLCIADTGIEYMDVKMDASKIEEANADLSQIEIDFCDKEGEKAIEYTIAPGGIQDVCYKVTNYSDKDVAVTVEFVDGTFTNDQRKNKACMQQGEVQKFGQYVSGYTQTFVTQANNIVYQHANIQLPVTSTGTVNGCLVYYTKGVEMGGQVNFTVLMRKAKFIDVHVQSKAQSVKFKAVGLLFGIIVLMIFFTKFHQKKSTIEKNG